MCDLGAFGQVQTRLGHPEEDGRGQGAASAGSGMSDPLPPAELVRAQYKVFASDIHDYGWPDTKIIDFPREGGAYQFGAVITNPPFDLAGQFIAKALRVTEPLSGKVAILQRHEFDAPRVNR